MLLFVRLYVCMLIHIPTKEITVLEDWFISYRNGDRQIEKLTLGTKRDFEIGSYVIYDPSLSTK